VESGRRWRVPAAVTAAGLLAAIPIAFAAVNAADDYDAATGVSLAQKDNLVKIGLNQALAPNLNAAIALPHDGEAGRLTVFTKDGTPIGDDLRSRLVVYWNSASDTHAIPMPAAGQDEGKPYATFAVATTVGQPTAALGAYDIKLDGIEIGSVLVKDDPNGIVATSDLPTSFINLDR
jgi:hypothetical protein